MEQTLIKDCEVEVCSKEEGFHNTWFRAILIENPTRSRRTKLPVRYMTLLKEDGSSPLIENVEQSSIRPVPPDNLYNGVVLEEGSVVDAYHRDGWWTGLLIKKIEDDKFLVCFDSPPDVIQFQRKQLRPHLDLIDSKWVRPDIKELSKSIFSPGTIVEVNFATDKVEVVWFPAIIIKELEDSGEKKFIVKHCYKRCGKRCGDEASPNMVVDSRHVRPTPPPFTVEEYALMECVEACRGSSWHQGLVRQILSGKRYTVKFEATKEEYVFKYSDLRPFKVWENGVWRDGPEATGAIGKKRTGAVMNDNTLVVIHPKETSIAEESVPLVTLSPVITATPLKEVEAETQDKTLPKKTIQPVGNQNGLGNDSTQEKTNSEDTNRKRKREQDGANVKETNNNDTTMVLPFEKKLPVWKKLESLEVFKTNPQAPHFSPLVKPTEISREMSAVGMTLTYNELVKEVNGLVDFGSHSTLDRLSDYFAELEKHGFDVKAPQMRIQKLLSLKDREEKILEGLKGIEKDIAEKENEKVEMKRKIFEMKQKILELQRREEEADKEIALMKSCATVIGQQLEDVDLQLQKIVLTPL